MYTFDLLDKVKSFVQNIEPRKKEKKLLTKGDKSGILHKSPKASGSLKRRLRGREVEKTSKKIQKPLDKRETL